MELVRSFRATGLVLKRVNIGEQDRIVTVLSKEGGKLTCVAKGCRKLTSSKISTLEPGSLIQMHLVGTKGLPILTQALVLDDFRVLKTTLEDIRKFFQILELLDVLLVEGDTQSEIFTHAVALLNSLKDKKTNKTYQVRATFAKILALLGFDLVEPQESGSLTTKVEALGGRKLKAFAYLY